MVFHTIAHETTYSNPIRLYQVSLLQVNSPADLQQWLPQQVQGGCIPTPAAASSDAAAAPQQAQLQHQGPHHCLQGPNFSVIWGRPAHHNQPAATPADVTSRSGCAAHSTHCLCNRLCSPCVTQQHMMVVGLNVNTAVAAGQAAHGLENCSAAHDAPTPLLA